jgi:hypothetical protein
MCHSPQLIVIDEPVAILVSQFKVCLHEEGVLWVLECPLDALVQVLKRGQVILCLLVLFPFIPDGMHGEPVLLALRKDRKSTMQLSEWDKEY